MSGMRCNSQSFGECLERKKKGELPTGPLFHTAKATGFKFVSEMLVVNTSKYNEMGSIMEHEHVSSSSFDEVLACKGASPMKPIASEKRNSTKISKKTAREELKEISNAKNGDSAGKKKSYRRRKICQEIPNEEKGNANDDTRACSKVAEKETKVSILDC
ncbi:uncharacterized protein LOC114181573 isoform X2 [Vigna unguiculata]|uniref:uncharacterized protein LOC114181573 isoform X2 n=1 Tax=Vigna unguiculata TaxID=3917 RepID=UPI0010161B66|nr:uncharacterized protein LOC114181573 isoform X2 [Vigna unguiculata]